MSEKADNSVATDDGCVPVHVAVIMDGNGRWARARGLPRHAGHRAGVRSVRETVETAARRGVRYLTLFAFSSENWRRPRDEVSSLMRLFIEALQREVDDLHRNNVRLTFIGAREQLQKDLVKRITEAEAQTADYALTWHGHVAGRQRNHVRVLQDANPRDNGCGWKARQPALRR